MFQLRLRAKIAAIHASSRLSSSTSEVSHIRTLCGRCGRSRSNTKNRFTHAIPPARRRLVVIIKSKHIPKPTGKDGNKIDLMKCVLSLLSHTLSYRQVSSHYAQQVVFAKPPTPYHVSYGAPVSEGKIDSTGASENFRANNCFRVTLSYWVTCVKCQRLI